VREIKSLLQNHHQKGQMVILIMVTPRGRVVCPAAEEDGEEVGGGVGEGGVL